MHIEITLLNVLFHMIIFLLLINILVHITKKMVIPYLKTFLDDEKKRQMEIIEKDQLLVSTHLRIENQIKVQKKLFIVLEKNIQKWHEVRQDALLNQEQRDRLRLVQSHERRQKQQSYLYSINLLERTLPEVLAALPELVVIDKKKNDSLTPAFDKSLIAFLSCSSINGKES